MNNQVSKEDFFYRQESIAHGSMRESSMRAQSYLV
jgi:hypothetical protein